MSLGCARCGSCCEHIWLNDVIADAVIGLQEDPHAEHDFATAMSEHNLRFLAEHWTPIERDVAHHQVRFACAAYDPAHKLCTAHADRPPVCIDFPWYGRPAGSAPGGITPKCSYWLDVTPARRPEGSRPLIPLTVRRS